MSLSQMQASSLSQAIETYAFPSDYFNFSENVPEPQTNVSDVETKIQHDLCSGDWQKVRDGLSNILYWGYAQMGKRDWKVQNFRTKVERHELCDAANLFRGSRDPSVLEIKKLGLPEFSGLSFVSKVRMFLDPANSATLDFQILKIRQHCSGTVLAGLRVSEKETQIRITVQNAQAYERWCEKMRAISNIYFCGRFHAADVERGFFRLVQCGLTKLAAEILWSA